jgi:uncharacterized membrane protein YagU involved in acid resistance
VGILIGGLLAGVLDIIAACVYWVLRTGAPPKRVLQGIAAAALGRSAFEGGWPTALLGLGCHFLIAFTAAAVYYSVSKTFEFPNRHPVIAGLLWGIAVYLFMYFLVLPRTKMTPTYTPRAMIPMVLIHMFFVGLPIALAVKRYSVSGSPQAATT